MGHGIKEAMLSWKRDDHVYALILRKIQYTGKDIRIIRVIQLMRDIFQVAVEALLHLPEFLIGLGASMGRDTFQYPSFRFNPAARILMGLHPRMVCQVFEISIHI